jgi:hypothetical protein
MLTVSVGSAMVIITVVASIVTIIFKMIDGWAKSKDCYVTTDQFKMFLDSHNHMIEGLTKWMERMETRINSLERGGM